MKSFMTVLFLVAVLVWPGWVFWKALPGSPFVALPPAELLAQSE